MNFVLTNYNTKRNKKDILELLSDGDNEEVLAKKQFPFITEKDFDYTVGGLFISFCHSKEIIEHKVIKPV